MACGSQACELFKSPKLPFMFSSGCVSIQAIFLFFNVESPPPDEEKKASGKDEDTLSLSEESLQTWGKHSISGSTHDLGMEPYFLCFQFVLFQSMHMRVTISVSYIVHVLGRHPGP